MRCDVSGEQASVDTAAAGWKPPEDYLLTTTPDFSVGVLPDEGGRGTGTPHNRKGKLMIHGSDERTNPRAPVHSPGVLVLTAYLALPATAFGTGPAERGGRLAAQTVVESEAPRDPDLVLADEPLVRIGMVDGPEEYLFGNVTGGVRLEDGSIVVADEQNYAVRRYDATGRHMWTSGRQGEGPGEYGGLRLLRGCPGATITVFDWHLDRVTQLDVDGMSWTPGRSMRSA